jgi:hypothetical protein
MVKFGRPAPARVICPRCAERAGAATAIEAGMVREREVGTQQELFR